MARKKKVAKKKVARQKKPNDEVAIIKSDAGQMVVEFWADVAPKTVENFKKLAGDEFYDGTAFHRVVKGFMIQGGDPLTKDPEEENHWGTGDPGYKIKAEFSDREHVRGVLSMARSASPDSASCQFFVMHGVSTHLDGKYSAFGRLVSGLEVVNQIVTTPRGAGDKPRAPQKILKAIVVPFAKKAVSR